jgi:hypothetical protein
MLLIRITLMRIRMRIRIMNFIWCGSGFWCLFDEYPDPTYQPDADSDPTFHPDADPDPSFQIKVQTLEKVFKIGSYSTHFGLSSDNWCGSRSGSGSSLSLGCGSGSWFLFDADPDPNFYFDADPGYQNDADPDPDTDPDPQHSFRLLNSHLCF